MSLITTTLAALTAALSVPSGAAALSPAATATTTALPIAAAPVPGGLLIADGGLGGKLEIVSHDVDVTIRDGIAVTTFEEVFRNTENRQVEALYTFPVPEGASVANFSMWIGGKEMIGEVVEKERAREIYDSYKRRRIDPGLLEQKDHSTFEMRIFPIEARAEQRVRVTYYQELDFDADEATYVYPLATTTSGVDSRVHGSFSLDLEVLSEIPIVDASSPSHPDAFVWVEHSEGYRHASLEEADGDLARDVVLTLRTERARTGLDLVASTPKGEDGFYQLTLTAGEELAKAETGMDFVFVADVSGSMRNEQKLGLSIDAIGSFLDALGPEDRFEIIGFSVQQSPLFGVMRGMDAGTRDEARAFLATLEARGGTQLEPALDLAYSLTEKDRPLNVVVLSDGLTEQREQATLVGSIRRRPEGSRLFCIGIGNDVDRPLLRQLARDAGGLAEFVSRGDSFDGKAQAFRRKLMRPAMENVKLEIVGARTYDQTPRRIGSLFHGSPLRVYGRYADGGDAKVKLTATIAGRAFEQTIDLALPKQDDDHPEIERMWAWHRVQELEDRVRAGGADDGTLGEIVMLCEGFSIPGERASFLVLESGAEYDRWKIERRNVTRITRDRNAHARLRTQLDALKTTDASPAATSVPAMTAKAKADAVDQTAERISQRGPRPDRTRRSRPGDIRLPSSGGGALGPWTVALVLLLLAMSFQRR